MIKKFALSIFVIFVISCSTSEQEDNSIPSYTGYYKITSFESSKAVDLDNDGTSNTDLSKETGFFFPNSIYEIEIRPMIDQQNYAKLISFSFPEASLNFYDAEKTDYNLDYIDASFGTSYKELDGHLVLKQNDFDPFGTIENFELDNNKEDQIHLTLYKDYYNFESDSWEELKIEADYKKIDL
ncbi:hypothetical protein [Zunongwangia atlantica]|uniref:Lipoprotein n=1 Tax=Zunongwangia atlantica 22II14-10F7 TaxID=1185767 RepID=A0A1Y1SY40_9FLAO|nr:hypothetical protein [Zunongwangia atlantica]ORL43679.1 hypothetical protein IIF7_19674 [Zunongwangia atlantica 22II14-10F7]